MNSKDSQEDFFRTLSLRFNKCLEPTMSCERKAIRAHSIQNANVFDLIHTNGHVVMPHFYVKDKRPIVELRSKGRNRASTFTGMCKEHDTELFKTLDTQPFDKANLEQLFQLAYRAVTRELHAVMQGALQIQTGYLERVKRGLDPKEEPSAAGIFATGHLMKAYETWKYRYEYFDKNYIIGNWEGIDHDIILLEQQPAVIAVASLFSLPNVVRDDDFARCVLNVFPISTDNTVVVFSYASAESKQARKFLKPILSSKGRYQRYLISKLVISRIENFALSPRHVENWSPEKTEKITSAFIKTIFSEEKIKDDLNLQLF